MTEPEAQERRSSLTIGERLRLRRRAPLLDALRRALEIGSGSRLLDVGGGTGAVTEALAGPASEVVVIEPSLRKAERGRRRRPRFTFLVRRGEDLGVEDGRFDRIVSTMAYHHFEDADRVLEACRRALVPGGRIVICDLDPSTPLGRRASWFERSVRRHPYRFEIREGMVARLTAHGYRVERVEPVGNAYIVVGVRPGG